MVLWIKHSGGVGDFCSRPSSRLGFCVFLKVVLGIKHSGVVD